MLTNELNLEKITFYGLFCFWKCYHLPIYYFDKGQYLDQDYHNEDAIVAYFQTIQCMALCLRQNQNVYLDNL